MKNLLKIKEIKEILEKISYLDWKFHVDSMGEGFYIQIRFYASDIHTGKIEEQHGRKWYISRYSTNDEIVRTCFLAIMTAAEHEIRENFLYNGKTVFGPHISIDSLKEASEKTVKREEVSI